MPNRGLTSRTTARSFRQIFELGLDKRLDILRSESNGASAEIVGSVLRLEVSISLLEQMVLHAKGEYCPLKLLT